MNNFQVPILLIVFNRPDTTRLVLNAIRKVRPQQIFIAADGPRKNFPNDRKKCEETRDLINLIDWACDVKTLFHTDNLGCKRSPVSAINWFFENVDEGIILEDDCLPDKSFFYYCRYLLNEYRDDKRIMTIAGTNLLGEWNSQFQDYHFTYHMQVWGWATWKRAWNYFDVDIKLWKIQYIKERVKDMLANYSLYKLKEKIFNEITTKDIDVWDYQWLFSNVIQSGLTIIPSVNLISNIGFGTDATHTKLFYPKISSQKTGEIKIPLRINPYVAVDREYEKQLYKLFSYLRFKNILNLKFIESVFNYLQTMFLKLK